MVVMRGEGSLFSYSGNLEVNMKDCWADELCIAVIVMPLVIFRTGLSKLEPVATMPAGKVACPGDTAQKLGLLRRCEGVSII